MEYFAPAGYSQFTNLSAAVGLQPIPNGVKVMWIQAEGQNVRWRDDGTDPTASVGQILQAGMTLEYTGAMLAIRFIEVTPGAKLNVNYYR